MNNTTREEWWTEMLAFVESTEERVDWCTHCDHSPWDCHCGTNWESTVREEYLFAVGGLQ
jgi:hypothetical protein